MKQRKTTTMQFPGEFRARFAPDTVDEEKRTVELVWTTGARVLRWGWDGRYWEELSLDPNHVRMDRLNNGAPFLDAHNGYETRAVIGVVESARLEKSRGVAVVRFAKAEDDPDADKIFRKIKDGILCNVSVGYNIYQRVKMEDGDGTIPVYRATDWEPFEISVVPMGADDNAGFRSGAGRLAANECVVLTLEETEMPKATDKTSGETEEIRTVDPATAQPNPNAGTVTVDTDAVRKEAAAAERARIQGIKMAVRTAKLDEAFADEMINGGVSLDEARARVLDKMAEKTDAVETRAATTEITEDATDKWVRGASQWLLQKAAVDGLVRQANPKAEINPGEFRGMSLLDLARESLERRGVKTRGMDKQTLAARALSYRGVFTQSTSDFTVLLENTMHKVLQAAYATTPDTWRHFCAIGSVSDFRAHNRYRLGSFGRLDKTLENGEYKNKPIPDGEKASVYAETYGNIIALTRKMIINDDMGAFNSVATQLGRAAKLSIEVDVYNALLLNSGEGPTMDDGYPLFDAAHNNISSAAAISAAALDLDAVTLASQTDPGGNEYLHLTPAVLLVPIGLRGTAQTIVSAQYDPDTANKLQKPNVAKDIVRLVVSTPRLTGTRRYMFADPAIAPVFEVSFLDGEQEPVLESQEGFRTDGVEWKVRLDYGVGVVDYRGAVTNAGT